MLPGAVINDWLEVKPKAFNPESRELPGNVRPRGDSLRQQTDIGRKNERKRKT